MRLTRKWDVSPLVLMKYDMLAVMVPKKEVNL